MKKIHCRAYRGLEKKQVYILRIAEGMGTEEDAVRIVTYYLDENFNVIFVKDPEEDLK